MNTVCKINFRFENLSKSMAIECLGQPWLLNYPFPNKLWLLHFCSTSLLKTLWEKEKLLLMGNFSFSHSVSTHLKNFLLFSSNLKLSAANSFRLGGSKVCCLGTGWNHVQTTDQSTMISLFDWVENIFGKGENAGYQHCSFSHFSHNVFICFFIRSWKFVTV